MGFELPESMKKFGASFVSEEEYKKLCEIDKDVCPDDDVDFCKDAE